MAVLTGGVSLARRWVGDRMLRVVDGLAGIGLLGFGGLLAYRTLARLTASRGERRVASRRRSRIRTHR